MTTMSNWISEEEPLGLSPHLISAFQVLYFNRPSFFYFTFEDQSNSYPHHVFLPCKIISTISWISRKDRKFYGSPYFLRAFSVCLFLIRSWPCKRGRLFGEIRKFLGFFGRFPRFSLADFCQKPGYYHSICQESVG